jgi:hypothetical protein
MMSRYDVGRNDPEIAIPARISAIAVMILGTRIKRRYPNNFFTI